MKIFVQEQLVKGCLSKGGKRKQKAEKGRKEDFIFQIACWLKWSSFVEFY